MTLLTRISHALQYRLDRVLAEPKNRRLETRFSTEPKKWLDRLDASVVRGADWFAGHLDLTMSALLVLDQAHRQTKNANFAFVDDRISRYRDTYYDPGLRAVDRGYVADEHRHLPDIIKSRPYQVIELMMIDAANSDYGDAEGILRYLQALPDNGSYGSTHMIVGGLLMKRAGVTLGGRVDALIEQEIDAVARANRAQSYAGDLFAERVFVLEWVGRHDLVSPAWALRLLASQRPDGGWRGRNVPPHGQSNQHTTSLAMAALAQFSAAERNHRSKE